MSIALVALSLNHGDAALPAISLRYNRALPVLTPEWPASTTGGAVACYAIDRLGASSISVRAQLQATGTDASGRFEVRALAHVPPLVPFAWWPSSIAPALTWPNPGSAVYWLWLYGALANVAPPSSPLNTFGEIVPDAVTFPASGQLTHDFALSNSRLDLQGVNTYVVRWRWQYRRKSSDMWSDFALTQFTVYTILTTPNLPWVQSPATPLNTQLPWVDVLAVACRWASGATTVDSAAARITKAINGLGHTGVLAYDCQGTDVASIGSPHYTLLPGVFDCSEFLERVNGGFGNGRFLNCSDCAAAVSTFANILGCDLSQSRMFGDAAFPLNPTRSIGFHSWLSACAVGFFSMHEVAWTGDCGENDDVFDACLEVDGDSDPTQAPHSALLPVNMQFGAAGDGLYRDRLAAPAGRLLCEPQPLFRQRRIVV